MLINFQALGCRLNQAELDQWANQFIRRGHQITAEVDEADVVVFNSCAVTAMAERKSRQLINRVRRGNPKAGLVVTGCYASLEPEAVQNTLGVDLVIDNMRKSQLVELTLGMTAERGLAQCETGAEVALDALLLRGRHRGFIKIQDGCRYRCTYCIVTIARGAERSRDPADIIAEINRMHAQGIQEIGLTGVHVGGYGSDINSSLYQLLNEIIEQTEIPRIRLASVEPWDLDNNFFKLFHDPRLMPHMHLPLQSGCDSVLRRMARRCKTADFARLADRARSEVPRFNITTDLIVGFPGETEQEWNKTLKFVDRIGFGHMHIFPFSARSGTKAAGLPQQIDALTKKRRSTEMHALAAELKRNELLLHVKQPATVMWEQQINSSAGQWVGYAQHYHRVGSADRSIQAGQIDEVVLEALAADGAMLLSHTTGSRAAEIGFGGGN